MWRENEAYAHFIRSALEGKEIFTLQFDDGEYEDVAECDSVHYVDDMGEPLPVYCFWTSKEAALACKKDEWAKYEIFCAPLADFIFDALVNMTTDGIMVGMNFSEDLIGIEIEPMILLGDLLDAADELGVDLQLPDYDELMRIRTEWEKQAAGQMHLH